MTTPAQGRPSARSDQMPATGRSPRTPQPTPRRTPTRSRPAAEAQERATSDAAIVIPPSTVAREPLQVAISGPREATSRDVVVLRLAVYPASLEALAVRTLKEGSAEKPTRSDRASADAKRARLRLELAGRSLLIEDARRSIDFEEALHVESFQVALPDASDTRAVVVSGQVAIGEVVIGAIELPIELAHRARSGALQTVSEPCARRFFASYNSRDRQRVVAGLGEAMSASGIEIHLDCLSRHPSDRWKPVIEREIRGRDGVLVFWSSQSPDCPWFDWEWRRALALKHASRIQVIRLDPEDKAPLPPELRSL